MSGYIKLWRTTIDHEILANDNSAYIVFTKLLMRVDRKTGKYTTGRFKLADLCNLKPTTAWKALKRLEKAKMVSLTSDNKKTIISICNWSKWQSVGDSTGDNKVTTKGQQSDTKQEKRIENREREPKHKTYFKTPRIKGISPVLREQVAKIIKLFDDSRAGTYNNTLHTQPIVDLIKKHSFELVYAQTEIALALPKGDFNPWFDKPIDLADHFDWLLNRPQIGVESERAELIASMKEAGIGEPAMNATLKMKGFKELE